ncbi:TRAP transporter large permease [Anaerovorax odorimutans]|uniref:TRAP transporter large permease n=1 Tax=Anaerovorax odorimutans TaxID=109327 RepID=A0ABT1RNP9_9FIRM|nr:TRAP transporter large permease [Anaerovorax odorimutans]MCQ4636816.1 TRAP transporter large permease [Anaerovorax odorimutans]
MSTGLLLILTFAVCICLGMPIAFALGCTVVVGAATVPGLSFMTIMQTSFAAIDSFTLVAIPFFILAGEIMLKGGLSEKLIEFCQVCVGNKRGSLGIVAVIACMIFSAISGSGPATVAAIGGLLIPAMKEDGYDEGFTCSLIAAAGSMGPVIPPSILFIMYAVVTGISVTDLFIAGVLPGIVMAACLCVFCYVIARKKKYGKLDQPPFDIKDFFRALKKAIWALLVPVIILGGIYGGFFTPTEAAIVACVYALIVSLFIYKDLKIKDLPQIFISTGSTTGYCLAFVGAAQVLGKLLAMMKVPATITDLLVSFTDSKIVVLLLLNIVLLIIGCFMEPVSSILIFGTLMSSIAAAFGVDPIHFGVIMIVNLVIGMCTPPVGINMFVAAGVGGIKPENMFKWLFPCIAVLIVALLIITYIPAISLGLFSIFG